MTKTHATMSAMTYGQRGLLKAMFNIAIGPDDDGNAAGKASGTVDDGQLQHLKDLIERSKANIALFLHHYKIGELGELPAAKFHEAVEMLNTKLRTKK